MKRKINFECRKKWNTYIKWYMSHAMVIDDNKKKTIQSSDRVLAVWYNDSGYISEARNSFRLLGIIAQDGVYGGV